MQKLLKILLLVISISYLAGRFIPHAAYAQAERPDNIGYGEPEETDFC